MTTFFKNRRKNFFFVIIKAVSPLIIGKFQSGHSRYKNKGSDDTRMIENFLQSQPVWRVKRFEFIFVGLFL